MEQRSLTDGDIKTTYPAGGKLPPSYCSFLPLLHLLSMFFFIAWSKLVQPPGSASQRQHWTLPEAHISKTDDCTKPLSGLDIWMAWPILNWFSWCFSKQWVIHNSVTCCRLACISVLPFSSWVKHGYANLNYSRKSKITMHLPLPLSTLIIMVHLK